MKENVEFGDTSDYKTSNVKKLCDTEILKDFEEEFGAENVETHTADIITADGQKLGTVDCKIRPITFDEAREYTDITPNNDLNDWYWILSPWSTEERGWKRSITIVSPSGYINNNNYNNENGVRPTWITCRQSKRKAEIRKDTSKCITFPQWTNIKEQNKWIKKLLQILRIYIVLTKRLRAVKNLIQVLQDFLICLLKAFIS